MFVAAGGRCGDAKLPVTMYETTTKSDGRIAYNKSAAGGIAVATQICCATATCQTIVTRFAIRFGTRYGFGYAVRYL
jgi:hypothetical protein